MDENLIKEEFSRHILGIFASYKGVFVSKPERDYGVDLRIEKIESYKINGNTRFTHLGQSIDFQLKTTSSPLSKLEDGMIAFDLPVRNYNDLVLRRKALNGVFGGHSPLYLIVVFLPPLKEKWLKQEEEGIYIKKQAFWFYPKNEDKFSQNAKTKRIFVSVENKVNLEFFDFVFNLNPD